ncbi:hypothetical protein D3C85_1615110 [compost metagenome]
MFGLGRLYGLVIHIGCHWFHPLRRGGCRLRGDSLLGFLQFGQNLAERPEHHLRAVAQHHQFVHCPQYVGAVGDHEQRGAAALELLQG